MLVGLAPQSDAAGPIRIEPVRIAPKTRTASHWWDAVCLSPDLVTRNLPYRASGRWNTGIPGLRSG
jgi:hypothetical protein